MFLQLSNSRKMITLSFVIGDPLLEKMMEIVKTQGEKKTPFFRLRLDPSRAREICFDISSLSSDASWQDMKPILEASLGESPNKEKTKQTFSWEQAEVLTFDFDVTAFNTFMTDLVSNSQKANLKQTELLELESALSLLNFSDSKETKKEKPTQSQEESKSFSPQYAAINTKSAAAPSNAHIIERVGDYLAIKLGEKFMNKHKDRFIWTLVSDEKQSPIAAEFRISLTEESKRWFLQRFPDCTFSSIATSATSNKLIGTVSIPIPAAIVMEPQVAKMRFG